MHLVPMILGMNTQDFSSLSRIGTEQQIASLHGPQRKFLLSLVHLEGGLPSDGKQILSVQVKGYKRASEGTRAGDSSFVTSTN
jgi:hypothetical protein